MTVFPPTGQWKAVLTECVMRIRWGDGPIVCPKCGSERGTRTNRADMPYRCKDCRKFFSVKTGTPMAESKLPVTSWLIVAYLVSILAPMREL